MHGTVEEQVGQGEQAHALVMGHVGPNHRARLAAWETGRRVVDGFIESELSLGAFFGESLQIHAGVFRRHHQRERRGIGRNHDIVGKPAFQSQPGHAECPILVVQMHVDRVVAGFRNPPRDAALFSVGDLPLHRCLAGLVEQGVVVRRHDQQWHEVFEHRSAP